jgi:hypothetical protein
MVIVLLFPFIYSSHLEQQYKDIQKLKEKQEKPNYHEQHGAPNLKISDNTDSSGQTKT